MHIGIGLFVIFIVLEYGRIENLMVDVPAWCMKMDHERHPKFNKKKLVLLHALQWEREIQLIIFMFLYWYMMHARIIFNDVDYGKY